MSGARYCPSCGTERLGEAPFCASCSYAFVITERGIAQQTAFKQPTTGESPPDNPAMHEVVEDPAPPGFLPEAPMASPLPKRSKRRAGPVNRPVSIVIGVLTVLLGSAVVWGGLTAQALAATQAKLTSTTEQLGATTSDLVSSKSQATRLGADNAQLTADRSRLSSDVATMKSQVSKQSACIESLRANAAELQRISELATANFNRTAEGSAWAKADANAITYYYKAYSAAFDRKLTTANSWIAKGNAAIKTKDAQIKIIDAATKTIETAEAALATAIADSGTTLRVLAAAVNGGVTQPHAHRGYSPATAFAG